MQVPTPVGPLAAPINLRSVVSELPGTSMLSSKRDYGTKSFLAQCSMSPNGPWAQFYAGSKARCIASGLTSGLLYYFRVRAIGAAELSPWSAL